MILKRQEKDRRSKAGPGSSSKPGTTKKRGSGAGNWGTPEDDILAAEQGAEDAELEMEVDALDDSLEETHGQISFEEYMKSSAALPRNYMIYMKQKDIQDAVRRFKLAANAGDAKGQFELGLCYENGDGLVQNKKEAEKWYVLFPSSSSFPKEMPEYFGCHCWVDMRSVYVALTLLFYAGVWRHLLNFAGTSLPLPKATWMLLWPLPSWSR